MLCLCPRSGLARQTGRVIAFSFSTFQTNNAGAKSWGWFVQVQIKKVKERGYNRVAKPHDGWDFQRHPGRNLLLHRLCWIVAVVRITSHVSKPASARKSWVRKLFEGTLYSCGAIFSSKVERVAEGVALGRCWNVCPCLLHEVTFLLSLLLQGRENIQLTGFWSSTFCDP